MQEVLKLSAEVKNPSTLGEELKTKRDDGYYKFTQVLGWKDPEKAVSI